VLFGDAHGTLRMKSLDEQSYHAVPEGTNARLPVAALLAALLAAAPGAAQAPASPSRADLERAGRLFEQAEQAYNDGELARAVDLLNEAHALYPEPVLLYNLARAHEALGHLPEALEHYERYLEAAPDTRDRGAIERRVATLRELLAEREREREQARVRGRSAVTPVPTGAGPTGPPSGPSLLPPFVAGAGVVLLAGGVVLGLLSQSRASDAAEAPSHEAGVDALAQARDFATAANVLFVTGGVLAAAGLTWWILDASGDGDTEEPALAVGAGPGRIALRFRWRCGREAG
jgi:tetratricopeptide (TPR) repeat protein